VFARVAYSVAAAAGLVLGAIAVVAGPASAVGWVVVGVFVGALGTSLWRQAIRDGAVRATIGPGRRAGLRVGVATCAGGLVLTGLARLLGAVQRNRHPHAPALGRALGVALAAATVRAAPRSGDLGSRVCRGRAGR
jgi:hypothetical protein